MRACMYICTCICMYAYIYVHMYVYAHMYSVFECSCSWLPEGDMESVSTGVIGFVRYPIWVLRSTPSFDTVVNTEVQFQPSDSSFCKVDN